MSATPKVVQLEKIKPSLQKDIIGSFWSMLRTLESSVDEFGRDQSVLKHEIEAYYRQWNAMTGDNKTPFWIKRDKARSA